MMSGFLLVNRVPGHFHIEMRSKHHNINPPMTNLSHVVNHLSFGPILPRSATRQLESLPSEFFSMQSTQPMNDGFYLNGKLHQAFHHYIKVRGVCGHSVSIIHFHPLLSSRLSGGVHDPGHRSSQRGPHPRIPDGGGLPDHERESSAPAKTRFVLF
jgi:hypothetical protein